MLMSASNHGSHHRLFGRLAVALALVVGVTLGSLGAIGSGPAGAVGPASQLAFTTNPSTVVAGATMTAPVVQLRDSGNNNVLQAGVTVTMSLSAGSFDASSTTSVVTNSSGQAVFSNLILDTSGSFTMTAASTGLTSKTSGSFTVNPGATEQVALSSVPSTVTSGAALGIVVTAEDAYGNKASSLNTGSVTLSVATGPAGGALAGTVTRTFSGGVVTFSAASLTTVGSYTITASYTDPVAGLLTATTGSIAVTAGVAKKLGFVQGPSTTTAGSVMSPAPTVQVEDTNGNAVADSGVSVTLTSTGTLTAGSTKVVSTDVNGLATFSNLTWNTAGSYTIAASASGLTASGNSGSFSITAGSPVNLVFTTQPGTASAGSAVPTTVVKIEDSLGNVLTSSTDTVTLSPNGPGPFDPAATTSVAAVNGVATFSNLILDKSGSYTFSASSPDGAVGTSHSFTVNALAATQLVFSQGPVNGTAGTVQSPNVTVQAQDQYGNVATSATGTVTLAANPSVTLTSGTRALSSGTATFGSLTIQTAGTYTLTASLPGYSSVTSGSFTIAPNTPYQLVFGTQPTNITAGQTIAPAPTVQIEDRYGNLEMADNSDTVTVAGSLAAGSTVTETAAGGVATFPNLTIDVVGNVTHTLTASSSTTPALRTGTSASFTVSPGSPYSLAIVQPQLGGQINTGNSVGTFYLEQYDQYGNNTWGSTGTPLTFSSTSPGGTFSLTDGGPSTTTATFPYPPNNNNPPNNRDLYFYYGDTTAGLPTITVSSPGLISGTQQVEMINVESPGDQTDATGGPITPLTISGQNSSPDYSFTSWSATGLPPGLSIDNTGTVTGTPTTTGTYSVEVFGYEGTYAYGYTTFIWTITNAVSVTNPGPQTSVSGTTIATLPITATDSGGETLTYADGGTLPPGLTVDPNTGSVTGTPTTAGTYTVTITATDTDGYTGNASFSWTITNTVSVTNPGAQSDLAGSAILSVPITATDSGGETLTYSDGGTLPPGLAVDPNTGSITGTPTTGGTYAVTITATDTDGFTGNASFSWTITDAVSVTSPGPQTSVSGMAIAALQVTATDSGGETLTYSDGGTLPPGLAIGSHSGSITGTPTTAGTYAVTITATDTDGATGNASFSWTITNTVSVTSPGAQTSVSGTAIAALSITATDSGGETLTYSDGGTLPPGLAVDPNTGSITGTPTTAGTYTVTITATDTDGYTGNASFSWTVTNTVSVTNPDAQTSVSGTAIAALSITATDSGGETLTYSDGGTLPPGLTIGSHSGSITGTPTTAGTYAVTITATDTGGFTGHASFTWTITSPANGPTVLTLSHTSGPAAGGQRVRITGTNLRGATEVLFGSTPGIRPHWNRKGTKLVVKTPAELAGTVDVRVVTPNGTSSITPADRYTFVGPSVTGVSPNSGPAAGGGRMVKISGTDFKGTSEVRFGGTTTTFTVNAKGTLITASVPAGTPGTVNIEVTTPGGTSAATPADDYTYTG
jgi:hypothetical protein